MGNSAHITAGRVNPVCFACIRRWIRRNGLVRRSSQENPLQITPAVALIAAGLVALVFACYLPALRADFVWDDLAITLNPLLRSPSGIGSIWANPKLNVREEHYWPVVYSVLWLGWRLWGGAALGYHLLNLVLHAANVLVLWGILRQLRVRAAWFAAALFAVHPVHVESVAWAIEIKDVLSGLFYLLALRSCIGYSRRRSLPLLAAAVLLYCAGMLSKSVVVTLPVSAGLILWWERKSVPRQDLPWLGALVAIGAVITGLDFLFVSRLHSAPLPLALEAKVAVAGHAFWFYLSKLFWPYPLLAIYPKWDLGHVSILQYGYPVCLVAGLVCLFLMRDRIGSGPVAAMLIYFVTLLPTLGFVSFSFMKHSYVADRFQYLASAAPLVLLAGALAGIRGLPQRALLAVQAVLLVVCGGLTWQHCTDFRNSEALFRQVLAHNPRAWQAHYFLADAEGKRGNLSEALAHYTVSFEGNLQEHKTAMAARVGEYSGIAAKNAGNADAQFNYGLALACAGEDARAAVQFAKALELRSVFPEARIALAVVLSRSGDRERALKQIGMLYPTAQGSSNAKP